LKKNLDNQIVVLKLATKWLYMVERRDVFQAIADPTRRMIIQRLSGGALNIGQIVDDFGITRQGIAKHLKVLHECGMVTLTQRGREQMCEARLDQLDEVADWVNESRKRWNQRFEKLDKFLADTKDSEDEITG
jgi:DNA-binding transcriptional ArsR family regulator